ncbi:MAG: DMT family transporter [Desulfobacteraceae bacterium]|nr:DMT family transporter [Desulfobacteraceae bacterium]
MPHLSLLTASLLWASSFIALKLAFVHYHPMVVIAGRMVVGSLCFLFLPRVFRGVKILKEDIRPLALMVLVEPCLYFIFEAKALELTTASQAGMITALCPLMVSFAAFFFLGERLTHKNVAGMVISVAGACWLSVGGQGSATATAPNPALGNFFEFLAMVCAAGYGILLKQLTNRGYNPLFLTALQAFAGSLFFLPALFFPSTVLPTAFEPVSAMAVLYLGSVVTLGAYGCYSFGVSRIPAGQASSFINLIPVFTLIMGMVVLNETLNGQQYIACFFVFGGIFLSQHRERKPVPATVTK